MTKCIISPNLFLSRYIVDGGFSKEKDTLWRALEKFCLCKILSQKLRIHLQYHPAVVQVTVVLEFIIKTAETPLGNYVSNILVVLSQFPINR